MNDSVDIELRSSCNHQVFLLVGYKVAVDGELYCSGRVGLPVNSIHPNSKPSLYLGWDKLHSIGHLDYGCTTVQ